jgi:hypothetical protein
MKKDTCLYRTVQPFKIFLLINVAIMLSWQSRAQFVTPSLPHISYPNPASSSDYLDNTNTKYLSNYSSDITSWSGSAGLGVDVIGWSYDPAIGGGRIAVGTHPVTPASTPFTGKAMTAYPDLEYAVDVRVAYMDPYIVATYYDVLLNMYMFAWFDWTPPSGSTITQASGSPLPLPTTGTPTGYGRVSMDINQDRDRIAIVYEDGGSIYAVGLELTGASFSSISPIPYVLSSITGPSSGNENPDISFNRDYSSSPAMDHIFYTYHNAGQQAVFSIPFLDLYSSASPAMWTFYGAEIMPTGVNYVNFDCPDHLAFGHWAYTYSDGNNIYLRADTANGGSPSVYTTILNDGTLPGLSGSFYDISSYNNIVPDLAYKHIASRDEIFVVWATDAAVLQASPNPYNQSYTSLTVAVNKGSGGGQKCKWK